MRVILFLFVSVIAFSCKTNHYLSDPIKGYPPIGLQNNSDTMRIILAGDYNLMVDSNYLENCLEGLSLNVKLTPERKIIDQITFNKRPDASVLMELKSDYKADGLLLLTKLRVQKECYGVPNNAGTYYDNRMPEPDLQICRRTIPWSNLFVKIISWWEYHDFTTGKSYKFRVENEKVYELNEYVADTDSYLEKNNQLFDPVLYQNGKIAANNLVGHKE
jgi:hypothetical protein